MIQIGMAVSLETRQTTALKQKPASAGFVL